ncbi:MAG: hypothetical protein FE78DRAFT_78009 [Acidomyces sp. 'richmondensis']|nr:MAG: hypothetical protein FE78DRAFT_78009 [Acidomyces sp. 'richmondensis']
MSAHAEAVEEVEPYVPSKPKDSSTSSFFSNLTRRLSTSSQSGGPKNHGTGGVCPRKVYNIDPNRQRCLIPELDVNRLRKVSFCVDVEIAGVARYQDQDEGLPEDDVTKSRKKKDAKLKERAEGEALKRPQALQDERDGEGENRLDAKKTRALDVGQAPQQKTNGVDNDKADGGASPPNEADDDEKDSASRKKEKKRRSEEERKIRRENRLRRAQENGSIPVEIKRTDMEDEANHESSTLSPPGPISESLDTPPPFDNDDKPSSPPEFPKLTVPPVRNDRPTTDPVRIYRRCCQLRETPILKRITEQLMNPTCCMPHDPGVVNCLDLTGSRLQLADVITLGDWLAVVPVKKLRLDNADLNDEGIRSVLAGLLAAKKPEPTKRRSGTPRHRDRVQVQRYTERSGVIEKLTIKDNPRITRLGWKHISLFLYMCRSLKSIDLSMNQFPDTLPASSHPPSAKLSPQTASANKGQDTDAAETFYKCLAERLGGSKLEELMMSECGLSASQIRRVIDGVIVCGVSRLGLAGNHLDDQGLEHVIHYLRSGVCQALDVGGNDLRGKVSRMAEAIAEQSLAGRHIACWGLSLADCNLVPADLRELFWALAKLPDFKFLDLSHNQQLCSTSDDMISLFRRYMSKFKYLKRIHLADVGMSPKQAIALADCLPDGPSLAHLNILENPQLSVLAHATDEAMQEEACALYASLMAAVRVSSTLICIDIDVPSNENSEVVKALAKQVVAYSLRNMEQFAIAEATGGAAPAVMASAKLTDAHGGEHQVKEISVPDVLMHLVGHVEGVSDNHDSDDPAPDDDYIVGGTGVVKALQYVLGEKANDLRRTSVPGTPISSSGTMTPREGGGTGRPGSSAGPTEEQRVKAKAMSKNLLGSARKIRSRLQPALAKVARGDDELAYRRLMFLDQTLQSMIQRFEEEYPETRLPPPSGPSKPPTTSSRSVSSERRTDLSLNTQATEITNPTTAASDDEDEDDEDLAIHPIRRADSEVSLASRAQTLEEGRLHRLGQHLRREVVDSPSSPHNGATNEGEARLRALQAEMDRLSGAELKSQVEAEGWEAVLRKVGGNYEDLKSLSQQDPEGWAQFVESHMKARMNVDRERGRKGRREGEEVGE